MGYLPHTGGLSKTPHLIVVDAVLTEQGRYRLAEGAGNFNITKFALGDDEIDYSLYDNSQPTENKDDVIMLTPVLEAVPDTVTGIRHFLYTAPAPDDGWSTMPSMDISPDVMKIHKGNTGVVLANTQNAVDPDMSYTVQFSETQAQQVFDVIGDNPLWQPDDIFPAHKIWTLGSQSGGGNDVSIRIVARTDVTQNPDIPGQPLSENEEFTYTLNVRGTSTGLLRSMELTWKNVQGGGGPGV